MGLFGKSKKERIAEEKRMNEKEIVNILESLKKKKGEWRSDVDPDCYEIRRLFELDPNNRMGMFYLGYAHSRKGEEYNKNRRDRSLGLPKYELQEAIEWLDKANRIEPDLETWFEIGYAFQLLGHRDKTIECFKKAFELGPPTNFWMLDIVTDFFKDIGLYEEAKECCDRYLSNHPDDSSIWSLKACCLNYNGEEESAGECYQKALELDPYNQDYKDDWERFQKMIARENELKTMDKNSLHLIQSENIIGIYQCRIYHSDVDVITQIGGDFCVLTNYNLYLHQNGDEIIIPLENISEIGSRYIRIQKIKYESEEVYLVLKKADYPHFNTSLRHAMAEKRNKIEDRITGTAIIDFSSIKEYLKNGGVVMQTFKCPGCGASLEFPDKVDTTTCQYCGNKIKAVDLFEKIRTLI